MRKIDALIIDTYGDTVELPEDVKVLDIHFVADGIRITYESSDDSPSKLYTFTMHAYNDRLTPNERYIGILTDTGIKWFCYIEGIE